MCLCVASCAVDLGHGCSVVVCFGVDVLSMLLWPSLVATEVRCGSTCVNKMHAKVMLLMHSLLGTATGTATLAGCEIMRAAPLHIPIAAVVNQHVRNRWSHVDAYVGSRPSAPQVTSVRVSHNRVRAVLHIRHCCVSLFCAWLVTWAPPVRPWCC